MASMQCNRKSQGDNLAIYVKGNPMQLGTCRLDVSFYRPWPLDNMCCMLGQNDSDLPTTSILARVENLRPGPFGTWHRESTV